VTLKNFYLGAGIDPIRLGRSFPDLGKTVKNISNLSSRVTTMVKNTPEVNSYNAGKKTRLKRARDQKEAVSDAKEAQAAQALVDQADESKLC
jgi:hypothetical protein